MEKLRYLNDDVPTNVLSRLPTKALLELKCVCKWWHSLFSDRSLIRVQLKKTEPLSGFFFQEKFRWCSDDVRYNSFVPVVKEGGAKVHHTVLDFLPEDVTVLSTSFGLVCCRSCMTLKWEAPNQQDSLALAFDPFQDPVDVLTKFKVVKVHQTETDIEESSYFSFEVFSSETREWRASKETCCLHLKINRFSRPN